MTLEAKLSITEDSDALAAGLADIVPGLIAAFRLPDLSALYINCAGRGRLDPEGTGALTDFSLPAILGLSNVDRFRREILPRVMVLGKWTGTLGLRTALGSEFASRVTLQTLPETAAGGGSRLGLFASLPDSASAAGNKLVTDEEMLHALLESVPDHVYFKDTSSRFLRISRAQAAHFGIGEPQEAIGRTDFDFFTAAHATPAFRDEQEIMRTGEPLIGLEEKETFEDGHVTWVTTTKLPFRNRQGKLIGTFGISHDITARKATEEALRESEVLFRSIFEGSNDAIILLTEGGIIDCNPRTLEMFGCTKEQLIGLQPESISPPLQTDGRDSPSAARNYVSLAFAKGHCRFDWVHRRLDQTDFPTEVLLSAFDFEGKRILQATVRDITERKRGEAALQASEATQRAITNSAMDAIVMMDPQGRISFWNPAAERIWGYAPAEALGRDLHELLVPARHQAAHQAAMPRFLTTGSGNAIGQALEMPARHKDGHEIMVALSLSAVQLEGQWHAVGIVRDITERKRAEAERQEMETQLQLAQKLESVGRLAAGVAHEINTPTQFVSDNIRFLTTAFAQLDRVLASHRVLFNLAAAHPAGAAALATVRAAEETNELTYLTGEIPRTLEQSLEGLTRIAKIVGSLKEFSHPGTKEKSPTNLHRAIETGVAVSRHEWKYVADVVTEFDPQLPPVPCVPDEFNQVILNLIVNAAHAIGEANRQLGRGRGCITIRTRAEADWAILEVADNGTGIPPEAQQRVFDPFFTTKGIGQGSGQGLAIVRNVVVKIHGGRLDFTTEVGKGTTFRIALPLASVPATAPAANPTLSVP